MHTSLHTLHIRVVVKMMVPFWGTLYIRCRIINGTQKGTIILTTTRSCVSKAKKASQEQQQKLGEAHVLWQKVNSDILNRAACACTVGA